MKTSLSIFILCITVSAYAQINQKTLELRKHYSKLPSYQLKMKPASTDYQTFIYTEKTATLSSSISTENALKPSTHSIEKAFNYYNSVKKTQDYSGFLLTGYSIFTKQNVINTVPQESLRFFPANVRD